MSEQSEIRNWISEILGYEIPAIDLAESLKDGVILCELINKLVATSSSSPIRAPSRSKINFFQMENIDYFIKKARECGVPDSESFRSVDLFENKNMNQIYTCLYSLSRNLYKNGRTDVKVIGPKLVEKVSIKFTQEQLDEAKRTVSGQYGRIKPGSNI